MRPNPHETADLVTFPEEILNGKLHYMCSESAINIINLLLIIAFTTVYQFTLLIYEIIYGILQLTFVTSK